MPPPEDNAWTFYNLALSSLAAETTSLTREPYKTIYRFAIGEIDNLTPEHRNIY
jgi:hypothetical protein